MTVDCPHCRIAPLSNCHIASYSGALRNFKEKTAITIIDLNLLNENFRFNYSGQRNTGRPTSFEGIRVPVESLFDHLEHGVSLNDFLDDFPSVDKEQAI